VTEASSSTPESNLGFPLPDPVAKPGCQTCGSYKKSIKDARRKGNESAVTDWRVLMQRHIDAGHG